MAHHQCEDVARVGAETGDVVKEINRNSLLKASENVIEKFKDAGLIQPSFSVLPQMKVVNNFYSVGSEKREEFERDQTWRRFFKKRKKKIKAYQLEREIGFGASMSEIYGGESSMEDLLESFINIRNEVARGRIPVTAIVGSAGSGKTTLLRRMVRETIVNDSPTDSVSQLARSFDLVHYIELKNTLNESSISPAEFLFRGHLPESVEVEKAYEKLNDKDSKSILYFDGLDEVGWDITLDNARSIDSHERADSATIMYNLLSGNLLPRVKIVIASHRLKIRHLPADAQPKEIIRLSGFTFEDAKKLFISLLDENGEEYWVRIFKSSKRLLNLMSTPIFLILTAIVAAKYPEQPPPRTVTELFNRVVLVCLDQAENNQKRKNTLVIIKKLRKLALKGVKDRQVVFSKKDLKKKQLKMKHVKDLLMTILIGNSVEENFLLCFCHQTLQEYLTASFVANMRGRKFTKFYKGYLQREPWSRVHIFVCGMVFDESGNELYEASDKDLKQKIIRNDLSDKMKEAKHYKIIENLPALLEMNDSELVKCCSENLGLSNTVLSPNEALLLSCFLSRKKRFDSVNLNKCGIDDHIIGKMGENLKDSETRITSLELSGNRFTKVGLNNFLQNVIVDSLTLSIEDDQELGYSFPNLDNVSRLNLNGIILTKEGNKLVFDGELISGTYLIEDRQLMMKSTHSRFLKEYPTAETKLLANFLMPSKTILNSLNKQFMSLNDFRKPKFPEEFMKNLNISLDCCGFGDIDPSGIVSIASRHEIRVLDFTIDSKTMFTRDDAIAWMKQQLLSFNCEVTVTYRMTIKTNDDLQKLLKTESLFQNKNIEKFRILFYCPTSYFCIESLIKKCRGKPLWVTYNEKYAIEEEERDELERFAPTYFMQSCDRL